MKLANRAIRAAWILVNCFLFAAAAFGDVPAPSPKQSPDGIVGFEWGYIIGSAFFAFAGVLVLVWAGRRIFRRSSK